VSLNLNVNGPTNIAMQVTSPSGTTGRIGVPTLGMTNGTITVNGTTVYIGGSSTGDVPGLNYAGRDANYVYFHVTPGTWDFVETAGGPPTSSNPVYLPLVFR
jgi:alpha-L-rhamnosidase